MITGHLQSHRTQKLPDILDGSGFQPLEGSPAAVTAQARIMRTTQYTRAEVPGTWAWAAPEARPCISVLLVHRPGPPPADPVKVRGVNLRTTILQWLDAVLMTDLLYGFCTASRSHFTEDCSLCGPSCMFGAYLMIHRLIK